MGPNHHSGAPGIMVSWRAAGDTGAKPEVRLENATKQQQQTTTMNGRAKRKNGKKETNNKQGPTKRRITKRLQDTSQPYPSLDRAWDVANL